MNQKEEFLKALSENNPQLIAVILTTEFEPNFDDNYAICYAAENGYTEIAKLLLNHEQVDSSVSYSKPLWLAAQNKHKDMLSLLIFEDKKNSKLGQIEFYKNRMLHPFLWAIENSFLEVVQLYIDKDFEKNSDMTSKINNFSVFDLGIFQQGFHQAIKLQQIAIVELLLDDDRIDPCMNDVKYSPLVMAISTRNMELLKLLLQDDRINPADHENAAYNKACHIGSLESVQLLEAYGALPYHQIIEIFNPQGHAKTDEGRYKQSYEGLKLAIKNKHTPLVEHILQKPNMPLKDIFLWSVQEGHIEIVQLLLTRINPAFSRSLSLRTACEYGNHEIVACLLKDGRVKPQSMGNQALRLASERGHLAVVELLLSHPDVNPAARENSALRLAANKDHHETVSLLLRNPHVNMNIRGYETTCSALTMFGTYSYFAKNIPQKLQPYYKVFEHLYIYLPWSLEKLVNTEMSKKKDLNIPELQASKLLKTCGLFQFAEPSLPPEVNRRIGQFMLLSSSL